MNDTADKLQVIVFELMLEAERLHCLDLFSYSIGCIDPRIYCSQSIVWEKIGTINSAIYEIDLLRGTKDKLLERENLSVSMIIGTALGVIIFYVARALIL